MSGGSLALSTVMTPATVRLQSAVHILCDLLSEDRFAFGAVLGLR